MYRYVYGDVVLELQKGDIARQTDTEAVVNAANAFLRPGGGVAGAIHKAAGSGLEEECRPLGPIKPGQAVITGAHQLPNQYVVHCLGPIYKKDMPHEALLASCYERALDICEDNKIASIAFPAISTGAFGYPTGEAATIAIRTIMNRMPELKYLRLIRMVLFSEDDLEIHRETMKKQM